MFEKHTVVNNPTGLHARPAALFVQTAARFVSSIWIAKGEKKVNAKSIMGVMSLAVAPGTEVAIGAEGEDEKQAVEELVKLVSAPVMEKSPENVP